MNRKQEVTKRELNRVFKESINPNKPSKENNTPPAPKFVPDNKNNKK